MRTLGAVPAAGLAAALALTACGSSTATQSAGSVSLPPSKIHIAFFTDALSNAYLTTAVAASKKVAANAGVQLDVFSADFDSAKQLTQIQDATSSGKYRAMVVEAIDGQSVCKSLTTAMSKGIKVAVYNAPICGHNGDLYSPGTIGYFGGRPFDEGKLLGQEMSKALGGVGSVAYISGPPASSIVAQTTSGVKAALAASPG
ncbi:MAG: substrate-binding domain-containing protein, partial [Frankia sp.]